MPDKKIREQKFSIYMYSNCDQMLHTVILISV